MKFVRPTNRSYLVSRPPIKRSASAETAVYTLFRDYIKHEDTLSNYRVTWMLSIHGFLYATYGLTLQKLLEVLEKIANDLASNICNSVYIASYKSNSPLFRAITSAQTFMIFVCLVGFFISFRAYFSIKSSHEAALSVREIFQSFRPSIPWERDEKKWVYLLNDAAGLVKLPLLTGGGRPDSVSSGFGAAWLIPLVLATSWVASFAFVVFSMTADFKFEQGTYICKVHKSGSKPLPISRGQRP